VVPRTCAYEDAIKEEARTVISVGCARIWVIGIVAVRADRRRAVIRISIVVVARIAVAIVVVPVVSIAVVRVPVVVVAVITIIVVVITVVRVAVVVVVVATSVAVADADTSRNLSRCGCRSQQQYPRNRRISQI
jgi:hypothetical protein